MPNPWTVHRGANHRRSEVPHLENNRIKVVAKNREAYHAYFVIEEFEAGISLAGTEVKSIRQGHVNLKESFAHVKDGEVLVESMHISPYEQGNIFNTDPMRPKKLLLHKAEIRKLQQLVQRKGYTLIPLQLYLKDGRVKLELGVCMGKQLHDKRAAAADQAAKMEAARAVRNQRAE